MVHLNLSDYLKPGDVPGDRIVVKIIDEGEVSESIMPDGKSKEVFNITVEPPDKTQKLWSVNKTTQRALGDVWGADTGEWIGKLVQIEKMKQMVKSVERLVFYGKPKDGV